MGKSSNAVLKWQQNSNIFRLGHCQKIRTHSLNLIPGSYKKRVLSQQHKFTTMKI